MFARQGDSVSFERLIDEQIPVPLPINDNPPRFGLTITMPSANAKALGLSIGRDPEFTNPNVPEGMDALIHVAGKPGRHRQMVVVVYRVERTLCQHRLHVGQRRE